jgi:hypothetical protein
VKPLYITVLKPFWEKGGNVSDDKVFIGRQTASANTIFQFNLT